MTCTSLEAVCEATVGSDPCVTGLVYLPALNSCCDFSCASCFGPTDLDCSICKGDLIILSGLCVSSCPLGFEVIGGSCVVTVNPFIVLSFDVIRDQITDSASGIVFETGLNQYFYPTGTMHDPIPVIQRGYYFNASSTLTTETEFIMSNNFTIIFYIKLISIGNLLISDYLQITVDSGNSYQCTYI